jgi:NADPH:quinone reductase-like Zn-dependent oxidoreductase
MDAGVVPEKGAFARRVLDATGGRGVDVVIDLVGGDYVRESIAACAPKARLVVVGLTGGASAEIPLGTLLHKRLTLVGTVLRARPLEEKIEAAQVLEDNLCPLLARKGLRSIVDRVFPLAEAAAAHAYVAGNASFGKVLLDVGR